ncbi:hypothetical protein ACFUTV_01760 [Streptomyces sp. NPDC057298]|uniref:hypothetical protein n=1 Tax=Streptomyces sp. NPDC057298 TaxID=3346091 RepID=UPI0036320049
MAPELATQIGARLVTAHQDDLLGAQALGGQDSQQADHALTGHGDAGALVHAARHRGVVAGKDELVAEYLRRFDPSVLSGVFDRTDLTPRERFLAAFDIPPLPCAPTSPPPSN